MGRSLDGALVLLTGASAGIGRATARALAARGARVVGVARSADKLASLEEELGAERFVARAADVADGASMESLARGVLGDLGVPDVVVANAGIGLDARFDRTTDRDMHEVLEVNVLGVLRTARPFVPGMIERGSGRLVFVSSIVGKRGIPHYTAYSASKFAVHGMAESLRAELVGTGVTVGVICPSSTESEFQTRLRREGPQQNRRRARTHSADSVAEAIVAMCRSDRREAILSLEARLLHWLNRLAPGLTDRFLARTLTR